MEGLMERRIRRLKGASRSVLLRQLATDVAEAAGLEPEDVFREAEAILARCAGLSLPEIAAQEGIDLVALEALLAHRHEHTPC
jgi:hypothetical protein